MCLGDSFDRHAHNTQTSLAKSGEIDVEAVFRNISADENGEGIRFRKVNSHPRAHGLLLSLFPPLCVDSSSRPR